MTLPRHMYLRLLIRQSQLSQEELAGKLCITASALGQKLAGKVPFKLAEAYGIMKALGLPMEDFTRVFPPKDQVIISRR